MIGAGVVVMLHATEVNIQLDSLQILHMLSSNFLNSELFFTE